MSRVIRPDSPSRLRNSILASVRSTLPVLGEASTDAMLRDRLAFIVLALRQVQASIEPTAEAWERRSYWVKADQFRRSWAWLAPRAEALLAVLRSGDLASARMMAMELEGLLPSSGKPRDASALWPGCFDRLGLS